MNQNHWLDITRPLYPGMPVWPGDHPVEDTPTSRIADGQNANVSCWTLSSHTGTHVDPPLHFEPDGTAVHEMDLGVLCGICRVLDLSNVHGHITAEQLKYGEGATRLLLKTRNSASDPAIFHEDFTALTRGAAEWLAGNHVRLIGVDGPSVEPFQSEDYAVHHTLLRAGIIIVEGLMLRDVAAGDYELVCAPLPWRGGDGSPCRALLKPL